MNLTRLALDLSPLVIATVHGYAAAWLAVKMLFRPRYPIYIFGKKLPFTPGLLPSERERFVETLAGIVAERLLTAEVISQELSALKLENDVEVLARHRYSERSQPEALIQVISAQLMTVLKRLNDSDEAQHQLAQEARFFLERQIEREYSPAVRYASRFLLSEDLLFRTIHFVIQDVTSRLSDSITIRTILRQTIAQLPEAVFQGEYPLQKRVVQDLVGQLTSRLDFKGIIKRRFDSFSNEIFEQIIYESAGREIRGIMQFGTAVGLMIGVIQTLVNLMQYLW